MAVKMFFPVTAYNLQQDIQKSTHGCRTTELPNLRVKTTCASNVQTTNTKIEYHEVLLHLFPWEGEKGDYIRGSWIVTRTPGTLQFRCQQKCGAALGLMGLTFGLKYGEYDADFTGRNQYNRMVLVTR